MTTKPQTEQHDTTPVPSGNEDTTPPHAESEGTTPPEAAQPGTTAPQADIDKIIQKRLDRERRKWEAEREEAEKRARMDESERLKAELADRDKQIAEAQAEAKRERGMRSVSEHVVDAEDAYAIAERLGLVDDAGNVDRVALLEAKPYLAKSQRPIAPAPDGAPTIRGKRITHEELRNMSAEEINANWDAIKATPKP
jgi:hypothetical protein